jgi:hypothetical protein
MKSKYKVRRKKINFLRNGLLIKSCFHFIFFIFFFYFLIYFLIFNFFFFFKMEDFGGRGEWERFRELDFFYRLFALFK